MVRSELSSEEQFFEQAIVTERFIKKYKNVIVAIAVAIAVGVVGGVAYRAYEENKRLVSTFLLFLNSRWLLW